MQSSRTFIAAPGTGVKLSALCTEKGRAFAEFVRCSGGEAYARPIEFRRVEGLVAGDIVVVDVQVERPQKIVHPILQQERIAVFFFDDDNTYPEVLALRADFPHVPHTNLRDKEVPRSLCLYEQPYENVKLDWTPARFLSRIRYWLQHTATGTLHGEDQPLEPLLLSTRQRLILPGDYSLTDLKNQDSLFQIYRCGDVEDEITLVARQNLEKNQNAEFVAAIFCCQEQTHGVIRYKPENLEQLHNFCAGAGLDLGNELVKKAKTWFLEKPTKEILRCKLIIILLLPTRRRDGSQIESVEKWAFMIMKSVEDIGIALDVYGKAAGTGFIVGGPPFSKAKLTGIPIATLQVIPGLTSDRAAAMNGVKEVAVPIFAIGVGALGSQVFNNLVRSGFGRWTLLDGDTMLPHNCARHFLGEWAVGHNKARAMAHIANAVLDQPSKGEPIAKAIPADFIKPGVHTKAVEASYDNAQLVLDFSASVAVSRHCAASKVSARHIAAFLTPSGGGLIVTAEDKNRTMRLDWLEMLHYRAVLSEEQLYPSLQPPDGRFRYGNSCRDVSLQLAQDDTAMWAAFGSKAIRQLSASVEAKVRIYYTSTSGGVSIFEPTVFTIIEAQCGTWLVRSDIYVLERLAKLRSNKLPNETGGVLLGHFDTQRRVCSIVEVVESPPDSEEWPTSYIRGCKDLQERVQQAERATLSQIGYVGEWHSHPRGAAVRPSLADMKAYGWLSAQMNAESLPGIMLIIGDKKRFCLVSTSVERTNSKRKKQ